MKTKLLTFICALSICLSSVMPGFYETVFAEAESSMSRLVDNADLLTSSEEEKLLGKLDEISVRQKCDIVVLTVDSLEGVTPKDYADDFFDYNGYGVGSGRDGVLLLLSMKERDWYVSTRGYGITAITDAGLNYMSEQFVPYLSNGDYAKAFTTYAQLCDKFISQAKKGKAYDVGHLPKKPLSLLWIPGALLIGAALALAVTMIMKGQLKSVHSQAAAGSYLIQGSLKITNQRDFFLYKNVNRRAKPKDTSSGGSSTHRSSSGATHGGGGGKF